MISLAQVYLWHLDTSLYAGVFFIVGMLIKRNHESWKDIFSTEPFNNKYFVAYLVILWCVVIPMTMWRYQVPRYGFLSVLPTQYLLAVRIALCIVLLFFGRRLAKAN